MCLRYVTLGLVSVPVVVMVIVGLIPRSSDGNRRSSIIPSSSDGSSNSSLNTSSSDDSSSCSLSPSWVVGLVSVPVLVMVELFLVVVIVSCPLVVIPVLCRVLLI